ncbi:MAG: 4-hydroxy-tetrahydrodipicolinate reductase [bacterium]|nr:4-hydroxy-tetrahydrodipicolinate reductase [bacterium]
MGTPKPTTNNQQPTTAPAGRYPRVRVLVTGACGRMGREVLDAVLCESDLELVGAVDLQAGEGRMPAVTASGKTVDGVEVTGDLGEALQKCKPDVMVDFTVPAVVMGNIKTALEAGVRPVVGTTGLNEADLAAIDALAGKKNIGALIAPNFAIGAVLMMKFAVETARYLNQAEIIEFHHDKKLDAPSGTAVKTAEMMLASSSMASTPTSVTVVEGARGGEMSGINIHSVRLPGFVASQEVIFGGLGQTLTIRHDTINRSSFMPGVILACRKVMSLTGLAYGLDKVL